MEYNKSIRVKFLRILQKEEAVTSVKACELMGIIVKEERSYYAELCQVIKYPYESDEGDDDLFFTLIDFLGSDQTNDPFSNESIFMLSEEGKMYLEELN